MSYHIEGISAVYPLRDIVDFFCYQLVIVDDLIVYWRRKKLKVIYGVNGEYTRKCMMSSLGIKKNFDWLHG
jgi:hypothetical protein